MLQAMNITKWNKRKNNSKTERRKTGRNTKFSYLFSQTISYKQFFFLFSCSTDFVPKAFSASIFPVCALSHFYFVIKIYIFIFEIKICSVCDIFSKEVFFMFIFIHGCMLALQNRLLLTHLTRLWLSHRIENLSYWQKVSSFIDYPCCWFFARILKCVLVISTRKILREKNENERIFLHTEISQQCRR